MRVAVGIPAWQDYELILQTIRSVHALEPDVIIVADGWIRDVVNPAGGVAGLPATAGRDERLRALAVTPDKVPCRWISIDVWRSQSEKRTVLLDEARLAGCDWLLQIDADEQLHNGELLRPMLAAAGDADVFPVPFEYAPGEWHGTLWKCVRVAAWRRWVAASDLLEHVDGTVYQVCTDGNRAPHVAELDDADLRRGLPWSSHHADERPAGRRAIRLGELEHVLEPLPANPPRPAYPTLDARPLERLLSTP